MGIEQNLKNQDYFLDYSKNCCFCSVAATVVIKRMVFICAGHRLRSQIFPCRQNQNVPFSLPATATLFLQLPDNRWIPSKLTSPTIRGPVSPHKAGLSAKNRRATSEISPAGFLTCWIKGGMLPLKRKLRTA